MLKKAFTLIELLVVISVIALLLGIMLPALRSAKEIAKATVCGSNLRQLTLAWSSYAVDSNGEMPGSWNNTPLRHGAGNPWDWAWAPWTVGGTNTETDAIPLVGGRLDPDCTEREKQEGCQRGAIYPYVEVPGLYHCPSDKTNFRSYSMPDCLGGYWGESFGWENLSKIDKIRVPARRYVFVEETDWRGYNMNAWLIWANEITPGQRSWGDPLTVSHRGTSSIAFADGHVDNRKWSDETVERFNADNNLDIRESTLKTEKAVDDLEWMLMGWAK